jgi:tRNA 2-selenouridine synthase
MFENLLANSLFAIHGLLAVESSQIADSGQKATIWIEDESQRIGNLQIPPAFWRTMRSNPVFYLDIPFEQRLDYITEEYSKTEKEKLVNSIIRIQKRLGGLDTKNAINHLLEDNYKESFRILLRYYDKWYEKALHNRENLSQLLNKIPCKNVDTAENLQKLISCQAIKTV